MSSKKSKDDARKWTVFAFMYISFFYTINLQLLLHQGHHERMKLQADLIINAEDMMAITQNFYSKVLAQFFSSLPWFKILDQFPWHFMVGFEEQY